MNSHVKISANIRIELAMAERYLTSPGVFEDGSPGSSQNCDIRTTVRLQFCCAIVFLTTRRCVRKLLSVQGVRLVVLVGEIIIQGFIN